MASRDICRSDSLISGESLCVCETYSVQADTGEVTIIFLGLVLKCLKIAVYSGRIKQRYDHIFKRGFFADYRTDLNYIILPGGYVEPFAVMARSHMCYSIPIAFLNTCKSFYTLNLIRLLIGGEVLFRRKKKLTNVTTIINIPTYLDSLNTISFIATVQSEEVTRSSSSISTLLETS